MSDPAYQDPPQWEKIDRDAPAGRNYAGELFDPHGGSAALDSVAQEGERAIGEMFAINLVAMIEAGRRSDVDVVEDYFGPEVHPLAVEQLERLMVAPDGVVRGVVPGSRGYVRSAAEATGVLRVEVVVVSNAAWYEPDGRVDAGWLRHGMRLQFTDGSWRALEWKQDLVSATPKFTKWEWEGNMNSGKGWRRLRWAS